MPGRQLQLLYTAGGHQRPSHYFGKNGEVAGRVAHHRGLARGAARAMQPGHLRFGHRKQAKGIVIPKICFFSKAQLGQVFKPAKSSGADARLGELTLVERHPFVQVSDLLFEPGVLQGAQLGQRQALDVGVEEHSGARVGAVAD
jgi:hypothetical protein